MVTATAFGMEQRIGAAWIDSAPSDSKDVLKAQISMLGPLADILLPALWQGANWWAGCDLNRYVPSKYLPCTASPSVRHVAVLSSSKDDFVPLEQSQRILEWLQASPACYSITQVYFPPLACQDMVHVYSMFLAPDEYRLRLCRFWTNAFGLDCDYCVLQQLPWYQYSSEAEREKKIADMCR